MVSLEEISKEMMETHMPSGIDKIGKRKYKDFEVKYINQIKKGLDNGKYKFSKYKQVLKIKNEKVEPRMISIPTLRDRLMLKYIHINYLKDIESRKPLYMIVDELYTNINSNKYDSYLKLDIKQFYDSINIRILNEILRNKGLDDNIRKIIICSLKTNTVDILKNSKTDSREKEKNRINKGVPQGIIISNALAEIYLENFDIEMKSKNIFFCRFVDDIVILFDSNKYNAADIKLEVMNYLSVLKLKINKEKLKEGKISDGINFLGYRFINNLITLEDRIIQKKEKKLERVIFDYKNSKNDKIRNNMNFLKWKLKVEIFGFISGGKRYGWLNTYSSINDETIMHKLDCTVRKIIKRSGIIINFDLPKFSKSYNIIKNNITNKMNNFDKKYETLEKKKDFISSTLCIDINRLNSENTEEIFRDMIRKTIYELEKDLDFKYKF